MTKQYFPRNDWLDVRLCGDGLGIHVLKWDWRVQSSVTWACGGIGVLYDASTAYLKLCVFVGPLRIHVSQFQTWVHWPWRRKKS